MLDIIHISLDFQRALDKAGLRLTLGQVGSILAKFPQDSHKRIKYGDFLRSVPLTSMHFDRSSYPINLTHVDVTITIRVSQVAKINGIRLYRLPTYSRKVHQLVLA